MNDLLYTADFDISKEAEMKIKAIFPEAQIEIFYDDIHENRVSIELPDTKRKEYLKFIVKNGYGDLSFYIQMVTSAPKFKLSKEIIKDNEPKLQELTDILLELAKEKEEKK